MSTSSEAPKRIAYILGSRQTRSGVLPSTTGYNMLKHVSDDNIAACVASVKDMIQRLERV